MICSDNSKLLTLLIRGGSIAAGHGVSAGFADLLKDPLSARGIRLINRSRHNETSFDGVDSFHEDIAPFHPDILMIHFGVEDAFFPVYRSEFKENLVRIIRMSRELFAPDIFLLTSHTFDNEHEMDAVNIYYRTIREVAVDLDCVMIPVHTWWAGHLVKNRLCSRDLVQADARWPNGKGHKVFAKAIINYLNR